MGEVPQASRHKGPCGSVAPCASSKSTDVPPYLLRAQAAFLWNTLYSQAPSLDVHLLFRMISVLFILMSSVVCSIVTSLSWVSILATYLLGTYLLTIASYSGNLSCGSRSHSKATIRPSNQRTTPSSQLEMRTLEQAGIVQVLSQIPMTHRIACLQSTGGLCMLPY